MAESGGQEKARWITTVIMSSSFQGSDISMCLQNQQHRVRFSDTVEHGSIIFSLSDQELILLFDRTKKFMTIHRNGFLLLSAALHGPKEWDVMFRIQQRFLGSNLRILPVHNTAEAIKLMLIIAKTTSKPHLDSIRFRMAMAKTQIVEQSPVWKMLQSQLDCSVSSIN
ncbi:protein SPO16 homolog isoform X2 [Hemicordylus capensis]|uniref:protein SPO16 homolog isoform X2 n=1 Tax=Hemicordylus capensis TaxID=884348 RepID=UPI0023021DC3|nr:protein SPO16 homolog isoform X2 [Hemicordylus capensis]